MVAVQFVIGLAFSIVPPVLALYLPRLGVTTPQAVRQWAGLVIGVTPLAAAFTAPLWGLLTGRIDRRAVVLVSCVMAGACTWSMSQAQTPYQLLALRFCMGLFGGHIGACMAIVTGVAPKSRLGFSLGLLATAQLSGALFGPLVGGIAADVMHDLRAPFFTGGVAVLLVCPVLLAVPASRRRDEVQTTGSVPFGLSAGRAHTSLVIPVVLLLLVQAAILGPQPIVSLKVGALLHTPHPAATLAGVAFSVVGLGGLLAAPILGHWGDTFGRRRLLLWCLWVGALLVLAQGFTTSYAGFVGLRFCGGIFLASIIPIVNSGAASTSSASHSTLFGITSSAAFMGGFLGPLLSGELAALFGLDSVFLVSGAWLIAAACMVLAGQFLQRA
jgi:DHA1 family multidrug resistance protein-like MFS transporter